MALVVVTKYRVGSFGPSVRRNLTICGTRVFPVPAATGRLRTEFRGGRRLWRTGLIVSASTWAMRRFIRGIRSASGECRSFGEERDIAAARPDMTEVIRAIREFSGTLGESLSESGATRFAVEFGFEIAVETGQLVAVLGKASAKSTLKVTLEWAPPGPGRRAGRRSPTLCAPRPSWCRRQAGSVRDSS